MAIRTIPCSIYNVPAVESWLEKMSRKGLHFKKFTGAPWAEFWVSEPREYRYRLEPCRMKEAEPDRETRELYHRAGWDYVTTRKDKTFHVWRSQKNVEPQELHTDPVVQSYSYEWLEKRMLRNTVFILLALVAAVLWIFWILTKTNAGTIIHPSSTMVPQVLWTACLYTFFGYQSVADLIAMRRLLKPLRAGVPLARKERCFPGRKLAWYLLDAAMLVYLALIWLQPASQEIDWEGDPAAYPVPIPFVSVERLGREEQNEGAVYWEASYLMESVTICEGEPEFYSPREGWISSYRPGRTLVHRLRLSFMADALLTERVEYYERQNMAIAERLRDERFDEAWYFADDEEQILLLRQGDCVLRCFLRVPADLREHLDLFAEAMKAEVRLPEAPECGEYHGWWR